MNAMFGSMAGWVNSSREWLLRTFPWEFLGMDAVEWVGIIASVFVLISFMMRDIRVIRIIGIIACIVFVAYGLLIDAVSIWLLNGILIFIHLFYLIAAARKGKSSAPQSEDRRLGKISRSSFSKKGLRGLPWFIDSDLD